MTNVREPLTLFFSPGACSLASHIALEESGLPYSSFEVNTRRGENRSDAYLRINHWGKVPALALHSGEVITEGPAIMTYIADLVPSRALLPASGTVARAKAMEWFAFISSSIHPAFRTMFRPERAIGTSKGLIEKVHRHGIATLAEVVNETEYRLGGGDHLIGDTFTLCDAYLTVFYQWSMRVPLKELLPPMPNCARVAELVLSRPAVQVVIAKEHALTRG